MPQLPFKATFRSAILAGRKTTTLRRWRRCRLHVGQRVSAPGVGNLIIDGIWPIQFDSLTESDANSDGFDSLADLKRAIQKIYPQQQSDGKQWFKVQFHLESQPPPAAPNRAQTPIRKILAAAVRAELDKVVQASGS
ncbi:MAG TPA: ASCH domain-containing protein [Tepidisphaeraceae bacterium]|nr:ASCH domain-containing protein [Tepidisphaeraceae bacterium]